MPVPDDLPLSERVAAFRSSVASDLYSTDTVIDFGLVKAAVDSRSAALADLDRLTTDGIERASLAEVIAGDNGAYAVICTLLSINGPLAFEDGRRLPSPATSLLDLDRAFEAADLLIELGIAEVLTPGTRVRTILEVAEIASDATRRRYRIDAKLKSRVSDIVSQALASTVLPEGATVSLGSVQSLPAQARRAVDYCLMVHGLPRIAVAVTFQTHSGGRQSRDLTTTYPGIQALLANHGVSFVLIADGEGVGAASERVLSDLLTTIPHCYSLQQAAGGRLSKSLVELAEPVAPVIDEGALHKIIETTLATSRSVLASSLPVSRDQSRLALASYASKSANNKLTLLGGGSELQWQRADLVEKFRSLLGWFDPKKARQAILNLFEGEQIEELHDGATFSISQHHVFSEPSFIGNLSFPFTPQSLRDISRRALQVCPEAKSALVISDKTVDDPGIQLLRRTQATLPVNLVLVDIPRALKVSETFVDPKRHLSSLILSQSDLAKISPYVLRGATPSKVFYGRDEEEAALVGTLSTNSVALLGGRRIGKTSLMRHSFSRLSEADFRPLFGDCQTVRTWSDFGAMAKREWGVGTPENFSPKDLFSLVDSLRDESGRPIVFLLDEIDQLLDWDKKQSDNDVPEAFFRTCRTISQSGLAQFVFAGERTIAQKLWDPSSPHWNFCRPIMLRQLTFGAASNLILQPLERLNIKIVDKEQFALSAWKVTDGHPELMQYLGNKLVQKVNSMPRADVSLDHKIIESVSSDFEYAEQYLDTYWGQATKFEKAVGLQVANGKTSINALHGAFVERDVSITEDGLFDALHMLELYGIVDRSSGGYSLRALWYPEALAHFGGVSASAERVMGELT